MQLTLEIPDHLAPNLAGQSGDISREVLEGYAVQGYRTGKLSTLQVRQLLGHLSRFDTEDFLAGYGVFPALEAGEVMQDLEAHRRLGLL